MPTGVRSTFWNAVQPGAAGLASLGIVSAAVSQWPWRPSISGGLLVAVMAVWLNPPGRRGRKLFFPRRVAPQGAATKKKTPGRGEAPDPPGRPTCRQNPSATVTAAGEQA